MIPASATSGELAQVLEVTERAVGVRRQDGRLPLTDDGRIDLHAVVKAGVEALGRPRPQGATNLDAEKARLAHEQAEYWARRNAQSRDELVEIGPIRDAMVGMIEVVKRHLFRLPGRLFPGDPIQRKRLAEGIELCLIDLSGERAILVENNHQQKKKYRGNG